MEVMVAGPRLILDSHETPKGIRKLIEAQRTWRNSNIYISCGNNRLLNCNIRRINLTELVILPS